MADDEAVAHGAVVDAHLLDAQAAVDDVVAALAGQRGVRLGAVGAQLLADDVVAAGALQVAAVALAVEAAVEHPDDPGQVPVAQVVARRADDLLIRRAARERPHPHGQAGAGDGHPDHDLG